MGGRDHAHSQADDIADSIKLDIWKLRQALFQLILVYLE
jgi:hypothetical protein